MGQPPPPTRFGPPSHSGKAASPAPHAAPHAARSPIPAARAPGPVLQGFFPGQSATLAGIQRAGGAYPPPPGFRLPAGPGQKLPDPLRRSMEQVFKTDFSAVRIHVGTEAAAIGALAFAAGDRIALAPGQYAPDTPRGQRLLAHELAHVVQQRSGRVRNPLGAGLAIVHDPQLEAEAERLAARMIALPAAGKAPAPRPMRSAAHGAAPTLQAYFVMGYYSLWRQDPAWYQPRTIPYAVVGNTSFQAQEKRDPTGGEDQFLRSNGSANLKAVTIASASLRVSDDYQMAIEDSDLRTRQPKAFFATDTVLGASAQALKQVRSPITLHKTGKKIRIVGLTCAYTLYEVRPRYNGGAADDLPQNCNEMARTIVRVNAQEGRVDSLPEDALMDLLNTPRKGIVTEQRLKSYARTSGSSVERAGLNAYAAPGVGEAFMIGPLTNRSEFEDRIFRIEKQRGENQTEMREQLKTKTKWRDYRDGDDREFRWPYHFAGVVAQSGNDRITLENYARGDNRTTGQDPRWYFQMYGGNRGQSFHDANKSQFPNAITIRYDDR